MTTYQEKQIDILNFISDPFISADILRFLCGEKIGSGFSRAVYECNIIKGCVVKVAPVVPKYNIIEMEMWQNAMTMPYKKWFAPCYNISPGGHILIQKRTRPITDKDKLPKYMPDIFTDIKRDNWGFIGNQLVCHDYTFINRAMDCAMLTKRQVKWD